MTYDDDKQICILALHTERFVQERKILKGVSPTTVEWYENSLNAFSLVLGQLHQSTTAFKTAVMAQIHALQTCGRGNKAVSINTYLRCLKAFLRWAHEE